MRSRTICCAVLGIVGLVSSNVSDVFAAEDLGKRNNLRVTKPTRPLKSRRFVWPNVPRTTSLRAGHE